MSFLIFIILFLIVLSLLPLDKPRNVGDVQMPKINVAFAVIFTYFYQFFVESLQPHNHNNVAIPLKKS